MCNYAAMEDQNQAAPFMSLFGMKAFFMSPPSIPDTNSLFHRLSSLRVKYQKVDYRKTMTRVPLDSKDDKYAKGHSS